MSENWMKPEDWRFAAQDARERHKAQVDLMHANTRQIQAFLQLYIALAATALSGAAVISLGASGLPLPLGFGLGAFGITVAIGAIACLMALIPIDIVLPGREAAFWTWSAREEVTARDAMRAYLDATEAAVLANRETTRVVARFVTIAKIAGAVAPLVGATVGLLGFILRV